MYTLSWSSFLMLKTSEVCKNFAELLHIQMLFRKYAFS